MGLWPIYPPELKRGRLESRTIRWHLRGKPHNHLVCVKGGNVATGSSLVIGGTNCHDNLSLFLG